jgi:organic hydroperoxide reductase OsmC/OhrA
LVEWTGNLGVGTETYVSYSRSHNISSFSKTPIQCSSDPMFRGDATKYNPEELFLTSISSCHMLWYLHLCADAKIIVTEYKDDCEGILALDNQSLGKFEQITLKPTITITDASKIEKAKELHQLAHKFCFIAQSLNVNVYIEPTINSKIIF